ncbi:AAA family ATPase [Agrobacterium sp. fls2-241-TYG-188a]|uniref:McrB family protein n=1 Tax=Agrobacterium sp. fls2-241-TYG-188a TaxID=3040275 RepID=UPI00254CF0D7|nr:AAA family ATPase [Agrobacterium sp. fls2-241-TYG-188a]
MQVNTQELKKLYSSDFQLYLEEEWAVTWRTNYLRDLTRAKSASREEWLTPTFQEFLWNQNSVANIGPGRSVTVTSAYEDTELAELLYDLKNEPRPTTLIERGKRLQNAYKAVLSAVWQKHNERRPRARIIRLLAMLYPDDMTCLMDEGRINSVHGLIQAADPVTDFMARHASVRERIVEAIGAPDSDAANVGQAIFAWFLWQKIVKAPSTGTVVTHKEDDVSTDLPPLYLMPADAQRRSLTCVQDNVRLLVTVVREAEHGITREDLVTTILSDATQLNASSAGNIISQALGGLGLLQMANGTYTLTDLGRELLLSSDHASVLRGPLVGRVFGMGHLLLLLKRHPEGIGRTEAAGRLQALVPSWTTKMPGSHIISWAKLTGMALSETVDGVAKLKLTEAGEEFALALPDDFESKWIISGSEDIDALEPALNLDADKASTPYAVGDILADGCFFPGEHVRRALEILKRKKNLLLQGPPGTGKTWLAKRLAYALIEEKDDTRVMAVQFQPSMSYEDFVRGWRPDGLGGLKLADGAFLEAVAQANDEPGRAFVIVIEEINRGNPAQILGELLTLLEVDKRVKEEGLRLAYPRTTEERVFVPPNLYIVGAMNLADRSLALVDLAMRRRFAFVSLEPSLNDAWKKWCLDLGADAGFLADVKGRIDELNEKIGSDSQLGSQFAIGHSFVTPPAALEKAPQANWKLWFNEVVDTEIAPLLQEYWFEKPAFVSALVEDLRLVE